MDYHQYKHEETSSNITTTNGMSGGGGGGGAESKSSFLCRQSSTRWIPTGEQVRILRDLYYNCGVRSPSAEQIQKISSRLRQYGKIEGKNVFYWFQNHKARERQKRRLTVDVPGSTSTPKLSPVVSGSCSSPGFYGGGSALMERSFGDSFIYGGGGDGCSFEPAAAPWMCHYAAAAEQEMAAGGSREIETLPLFPIYSQEQEQEQEQEEGCGGHVHPTAAADGGGGYSWRPHQTSGYFPAFYLGGGGGLHHDEEDGCGGAAAAAASLELSLSSYYCAPPGST